MTAVLEAQGYGKRYRRRTWALRGLDLSVPEGSITALVGPNGSGKSTLIRSWIGFENADRGPGADGRDRPARGPACRRSPRRLRAAVAVPLPGPHGRRAHRPRGDPPGRLRPGDGHALRRAPRDPAPARGPASCPAARGPRSGWRSRSATRAPILLLDEPLASPRPPRPPRVPPPDGRGGPGGRHDGLAVVPRDHRHRAGLRPADRPRARATPCSTSRSRRRSPITGWSRASPRRAPSPRPRGPSARSRPRTGRR